ncbi:MAG: hypothetical protein AB7V18_00225 [Pyrinomonadaceae bacterium]
MNENKKQESSVSKATSYEGIGEYWDAHSLEDHWDQTREAEFEVTAKRRHRIAIAPEVYEQIEIEAQTRGVIPEHLANVLLSERLAEISRR